MAKIYSHVGSNLSLNTWGYGVETYRANGDLLERFGLGLLLGTLIAISISYRRSDGQCPEVRWGFPFHQHWHVLDTGEGCG